MAVTGYNKTKTDTLLGGLSGGTAGAGSLGYFTPEQFGAKADGSTDDGPAITAAINAAAAKGDDLGGATKVMFANGGSYRVKTSINMQANVEVIGNGATLHGPITNYAAIRAENNPAVPAASNMAGQIAGACFTDNQATGNVLYGIKIRDMALVDFRYGILTACFSWAYTVISDIQFYNVNIGVFAYQGSQQMRLIGVRSQGDIAGTTFVSSATGFLSGHPLAGQDNYFTDQFMYDGGLSNDRDQAVVNATFDTWFQNAILRPSSNALSAQHSGGWVFPFPTTDDACQVSGRNIYIPQRNGRNTYHFQIRSAHSQNCARGVALVGNPQNLDVANIGGEGMFPNTPHAMIVVLMSSGVNPTGCFRSIDATDISPGTASYAVEVRNGSSGGVGSNTASLVGLNITSNGQGKVNFPGQWSLLTP